MALVGDISLALEIKFSSTMALIENKEVIEDFAKERLFYDNDIFKEIKRMSNRAENEDSWAGLYAATSVANDLDIDVELYYPPVNGPNDRSAMIHGGSFRPLSNNDQKRAVKVIQNYITKN